MAGLSSRKEHCQLLSSVKLPAVLHLLLPAWSNVAVSLRKAWKSSQEIPILVFRLGGELWASKPGEACHLEVKVKIKITR